MKYNHYLSIYGSFWNNVYILMYIFKIRGFFDRFCCISNLSVPYPLTKITTIRFTNKQNISTMGYTRDWVSDWRTNTFLEELLSQKAHAVFSEEF